MTLIKLGLRIWIAVTSVFSFLVGWIMLAHSPKPSQPTSSSAAAGIPDVSITPLPTLAPLSPLNFSNNNGFQSQSLSVQPAPQPQIQTQTYYAPPPSFVTGGS